MDIHRSRFVPYPSSAINAIAFSHQEPDNDVEDPDCLRLAIGRANGNIEIWNPCKGTWLQERVFSGGKDRSVEGLAWIQEPPTQDEDGNVAPGRLRLFSIGYSSSITEWNLATGLPERHSDGNHSEVWCFAVQPKSSKSGSGSATSDQQQLVAGCADGTLVLLSTADNELRFERFLSRSSTKKARALSVTYKDRNTVLAGYADSMIRVFDARNGNVLRNISLGSGPPGGPKEILVWKVRCLSNGDFVTGDSTGDVRIYEGKNYSQVQRISGHEADVLDIAVSRDGTKIFSAGMDRRTCFYSCSKRSGAARGNRGEKWRKVSHQRYHDHDVKALAAFEGNKLNVIVSGGIDAKPVVVPLRQFGKELSRGLATLPRVAPLVSASGARLMVSWWNCELRIWRVKSQIEGSEKPKVVARMALQGDENITSVSVTDDGELLAVATASEVRLFQLSRPKPGSGSGLRIRKLEMPSKIGAQLVRFSKDGKWLALVTASNDVHLVRIVRSDDGGRPRILPQLLSLDRLQRPKIPQDPLNGPWGSYNRSIMHADFSTDNSIFAVADVAGCIDTWVVEGHEDSTAPDIDVDESSSAPSAEDDEDDEDEVRQERITVFGQRWVRNPSGHLLPRLDSMPLLLSFQPGLDSTHPEPNGNPAVHPTRQNPHPHSRDLPTTDHCLFVVSAGHQMYQFEVLAGRLSDWSRRNPPSIYPAQFRMLQDPAKGCVWDVTEARQRVWLYGERWLYMFDLAKDLPPPGSTTHQLINGGEERGPTNSKKRARDSVRDAAKKINSGAGDAVPESETPVTKMRKFNSGKSDDAAKSVWIDANQSRHAALNEEDGEDKDELWIGLRTSGKEADASENEGQQEQKKQESCWHTLKYRPILGMVSVGGVEQPLEVVLVERPSWDLELPPRFVGSHE
ncbi:WD40 repeat-like protein [Amniculicola lignicola CBS 123094]|uniref:WD40 repeat-like protein n=1 Tax=Amniculicola lignicola CBS 123094 TaxID=1392246 RepID=A0A6A5X2I3_9PLEO|nr:WD40 repeat-like protein [Amniculicola lignicola CBS 123094]